MNAARVARNVSAAAVAGIAAWSSYSHMVTVALRFGERESVAYVLPLSVDGLLVVASVAMVDDRRGGGKPRWITRLAFVAGVAASIGANIAAASPSIGARIVAGWPALALLLVVEMLAGSRRSGVPGGTPEQVLSTPRLAGDTYGVSPEPRQSPAETAAGAESSAPECESRAELPRQRTRRPVAETLALVEAIRAKNPDATRDDLADELGLSRRRVDEILAAADAVPAG